MVGTLTFYTVVWLWPLATELCLQWIASTSTYVMGYCQLGADIIDVGSVGC